MSGAVVNSALDSILVVGRTGQVAQELQRASWPRALSPEFLGRQDLDLACPSVVRREVRNRRPAIVINAAAYTAVDAAEHEQETAYAVNRDGPGALAEACAEIGATLIHLSTDYVFDGAKLEPYDEDDIVNPLSVYGKSKAAGETLIRARLGSHVILRTAWVYAPFGRNFVRTMLRLGVEHEQISVVDDQRGSPTAAAEIARALVVMSEALQSGKTRFGTYHFCGAGDTTWHGFAHSIFAGARQRGTKIPRTLTPISSEEYSSPARRPHNSVLSSTRIARDYGIAARPWQDSLAACLDELCRDR